MKIDDLVPWTAAFADGPLHDPVRPLAAHFADFVDGWPKLADYQALLDTWPTPVVTRGGQRLRIVAQDGKPRDFEEHYAPRIYLTGELQTRTQNWHDFFQFLTWLLFPRTKAAINAMHLPHAQARIESGDRGRRSPLENMLSLFDEGGVVVVSSDDSLLELVRDFQWKTLFWTRRQDVVARLACVTFGHALYEKGLAPYLGMTGNAILLQADEAFFSWPQHRRFQWLDAALETLLTDGTALSKPKDLCPFPVLGMPGWDPANSQEIYYDNTRYFRPGRAAARSE